MYLDENNFQIDSKIVFLNFAFDFVNPIQLEFNLQSKTTVYM